MPDLLPVEFCCSSRRVPSRTAPLARAIKDYVHGKNGQQFAGEKGNFSSPRNHHVIAQSFMNKRKPRKERILEYET